MKNQKELDQALLSAAKAGELKKVQSLIEQKANVNTSAFSFENAQFETPLSVAAENGHDGVVKTLLAAKAEVDGKQVSSYSKISLPLLNAIKKGHIDVIKTLISSKANVEWSNRRVGSPLCKATEQEREDIVKALIAANAKPATRGKDDKTPLDKAIEQGHESIAKVLIAAKASVSVKNKQGMMPLHQATEQGRKAIAQVLIAAKANLEATNKSGATPLHQAAEQGHEAVAQVLIAAKANIEAKNEAGTPLDQAINQGHAKLALLLLRAGFNRLLEAGQLNSLMSAFISAKYDHALELIKSKKEVNQPGLLGSRPLGLAAQAGQVDLLKALLVAGAQIDATDDMAYTALMWACALGHIDSVKSLILNKANLETKDRSGETPLHKTAVGGHETIVRHLIESKANVDAEGREFGSTPLYIAVKAGHEKACRALIAAKANVGARNFYYKGPLHWSAQQGHAAITKMLIEAKANVNAQTEKLSDTAYICTPLHLAAASGHEAIAKALIAAKANLEISDSKHKTALHFASNNGSQAIVKALISAKANLEAQDNEDKTPLFMASKAGHQAVVNVLIEAKAYVDGVVLEAAHSKVVERLFEAGREGERSNQQREKRQLDEAFLDAASAGELKQVKSLIAQKAGLETVNCYHGATALYKAAENGHESVVKALIAAKANLEAKIKDESLLQKALGNGHKGIVKALIEAKAYVDLVTPRAASGDIKALLLSARTKLRPQGQSKQSKLNEALLTAANAGDSKKVQSLLEQKANLNVRDWVEDDTPLQKAAKNGHENMVKALLEAKARTNLNGLLSTAIEYGHSGLVKVLLAAKASLDNKENARLLYQAATNGDVGIIKALIVAKANLNPETKEKGSDSPLHKAIEKGHDGVVKALIAGKANLDLKVGYNDTPLRLLIKKGNESLAKILIDAKAILEISTGSSSLFSEAMRKGYFSLAVWMLHKKLVRQFKGGKVDALTNAIASGEEARALSLVESKAAVNKSSLLGSQVLSLATQKGQLNLLKALLHAGADIDAKDDLGYSALHWACILGHMKIVNTLIAAKANIEAKNKYGATPLHSAAAVGYDGVVKKLIAAKANVEAKTQSGTTPLHSAAYRGYDGVVKILIAAKANIEAKNKDGKTPLHSAVSSDRDAIVKTLIAAKATAEEKDNRGETLLHLAAGSGHDGIVNTLITAKANLEAKDQSGETPLCRAVMESRNKSTVKVLLEAKANPDVRDKRGTLMEYIIEFGNEGMLQILTEWKANLNQKGNSGSTPLNFSVERYSKFFLKSWTESDRHRHRMMKSLIQSRANPNIKGDHKGYTPLHWCIYKNNLNVVKALIDVKAGLEEKTNEDDTSLHLMLNSRLQSYVIIYQLLISGASLLTKDRRGRTPFDNVKELNNFSNHGENLMQKLTDSHMALVEATNKGNIAEIAILIEKKGDIEARDETGHTLLAIAARNADVNMTKQLLEMKADPVAACMFAAQNNQLKILKELMRHGEKIVSYRAGGLSFVAFAAQFDSLDCVRFLVKNYAKVTPEVIRLAIGSSKHFLKQALEDETSIEHVGRLDRYGNLTVSFSVDYKDLSFDKPLGAGAYGEVILGTYQFNPVAIKKLKAELFTPAIQKEFLLEASVMGSLNSNYLVNLLGVCTQEGHYSMVMEYVPGGSLYDLLKDKSKTLSSSQQLQIAFEMAAGLACLHDRRILHRDLKSLNVLMHYEYLFPGKPSYHAKLCDFGLVSMRNAAQGVEEKQENKSVVGTTLWMAPELFRGIAQSESSDVYALGLVIWELVTRQVPFAQERKAIFENITLTNIEQVLKQASCRAMLAGKKLSAPNATALNTAFTALKKDNFKRKAKTNDEQAVVAILNFITKQLLAQKMDATIKAGQLPLPKLPATLDKNLSETIRSCCVYDPEKRPSAKSIANRLLLATKASAQQLQESKQESKAIIQAKATPKAMQHIVLVQTEKTVAHHLEQHGLFVKRVGQGTTSTVTAQFDIGLTTELPVAVNSSKGATPSS